MCGWWINTKAHELSRKVCVCGSRYYEPLNLTFVLEKHGLAREKTLKISEDKVNTLFAPKIKEEERLYFPQKCGEIENNYFVFGWRKVRCHTWGVISHIIAHKSTHSIAWVGIYPQSGGIKLIIHTYCP